MFEESKAWIFLLLVGVLIGLGYTTHYLTEVDNANAALLDAKKSLADSKEALALRKDLWDKVDKAGAKYRETVEQNTVLLKARDVLEKRYRTVDSDLKYAAESMSASVDKMRNNAPGSELGDITLSNGKVLRTAKIRKVEESGISMIHSDGIGVVPVELLPADLKEKYDFGSDALAPALAAAQKDFLAKIENEKTAMRTNLNPEVSSGTSPDVSPASSKVDFEKIKKIKLRMAEIDSRLEAAEKIVAQHRNNANNHRQLASDAKSRGQPSTLHTMNATAALAQANQVDRLVADLRAERKKLDVELEFASKTP